MGAPCVGLLGSGAGEAPSFWERPPWGVASSGVDLTHPFNMFQSSESTLGLSGFHVTSPKQGRVSWVSRARGLSAARGSSGLRDAVFSAPPGNGQVPQEAVGFVTGRAGNFLRSIEEPGGA